jgi:hypothetical protein
LEEKALFIEIYVHLLDEGTEVLRPVQGKILDGGKYEIIATPDYDPEYETWQFPPGSIVSCRAEIRQGKEYLVAVP